MPYLSRIQRLQDLLKEEGIDGAVIDDPHTLLYLSGQQLSAGRILVFQDSAELIVDGRYFERCNRESPLPSTLSKPDILAKSLKKRSSCESLGFDSDELSYSAYQKLREELPSIELKPFPSLGKRLRRIKDFPEQQALRAAADLGSQGFDFVCSILKEGITELEVARELEIFWRRKGGQKLAFDPIIAFGKHSSMPHYHCGEHPLRSGDTVLIDIGVTYLNYNSDMTRVVFFGEPPAVMQEIYALVLQAQREALAACKPGVTVGELDLLARRVIEGAGYADAFPHSLGHGIGLDVHEFPTLSSKSPSKETILESGMAVTIEPGIYLPELGGVRIEDTVIITDDGHDNLTQRSTELQIIGS